MRRVAIAGLVLLVATFVVCSWIGVDFGGHWDEIPWVLQPAADAIRNGSVIPTKFQYPSMTHDFVFVTAIPHLAEGREWAARAVLSKPFLLKMRRVVAAMTSLTIVWVFLLVLVWRESPLEALVAAAITAGSWELQYHARWIAPDVFVVQFAALTLFCAVAGYRRKSVWMLRASAIAAGLACSSKYPAGLLLLTVFAACWFSAGRVRRIIEAGIFFAAAFLVTTPGALVAMPRFLEGVQMGMRNYAAGWGVYTVSAPFEHVRLMFEYIALVTLSHTPLIAAFFAISAILGAVVVIREEWRVAAIVLIFPVTYLLYFATRKIMVARNTLVIIPFLAALAAIGIGVLIERFMRTRGLKVVVVTAVAVMVLINLAWLWTAARSIRRPANVYLAQLAEYLESQPDRRFALSPGVAESLRRFDGRARPVTNPNAPGVDAFVFFALESPSMPFRPNRRDSVERWFGAHEVNFNYYPSWVTADRILVMEPRKVLWLSREKPDA